MSDKGDNHLLYQATVQKATIYTAAVLSLGVFVYFRSQSKKQERKAKQAIKAQRRRQRNEDNKAQKPPKKITLYFNKYDEFVDENTALSDLNNYYHKYH